MSTSPTPSTLSPNAAQLTSNSLSSATSSSNPVSSSTSPSTAPTTSPSQSTITPQNLNSTNSNSTSTSSNSTSQPSGSTSSNDRLSNGAVAGIVIAVALGLSLLTFLVTFLFMRRQNSKSRRRSRSSKDSRGVDLSSHRHQGSTTVAKKPLPAEPSGASRTYENHLPQSADDKTIQHKVKSILEQIELYVENFYRNSSSSALTPDNAALSVFDSPYLPASLASLLPRSKNRVNIMKHALTQSVTSSITPSASPSLSLLPAEYTLLPNTVTSAGSRASLKPGFVQILSRWRVMTAYLRPEPTKDAAYLAQRDKSISDTVQSFAKAFAPWKSTGYKDEERARSLSAILEDAANLGIFIFSQPSTLMFHWPASSKIESGKIVVSPALLKTTDETGRDLVEAQVMVHQEMLDA